MATNFLKITVLWFDEDLLELEVQVSNDLFKGRTNFYTSHDGCRELASTLRGFPSDSGDMRIHQFGGDDLPGYGSAFIRVSSQDALGHVLVQVEVTWKSAFANDVCQSAGVRLHCCLGDLDAWADQLQNLSLEIGQSVVLVGMST